MVSIIQVNGTGRSVNSIQHKRLLERHLGDKHLFNYCYIYIYIYIYMLLEYMLQLISVMT